MKKHKRKIILILLLLIIIIISLYLFVFKEKTENISIPIVYESGTSSSIEGEIAKLKAISEQINKRSNDLEFLELNLLYGSKCKKNIFNKLYKVGTPEYRACVLNKGIKIKKN